MEPKFKHDLIFLWRDAGQYEANIHRENQRLQVDILPEAPGYTAKFNVSILSDRGKISFRSSNVDKLRELIVNLSLIYFTLNKNLEAKAKEELADFLSSAVRRQKRTSEIREEDKKKHIQSKIF